MKQIQIIGNIGRDAHIHNSNGNEFVSFPVGVSEKWTNAQGEKQERTDWFSVISKQKSLAQYLKKGTKVFVQGALKAAIYHNEKQNAKAIDLTINSNTIQLLSANSTGSSAATPEPAAAANAESDDLPF